MKAAVRDRSPAPDVMQFEGVADGERRPSQQAESFERVRIWFRLIAKRRPDNVESRSSERTGQ